MKIITDKEPRQGLSVVLLISHTVLISLYPVLSLAANNLGEIPLESSVRSLVISFAFALVILVLVRLAIGKWLLSSILASAFLIFFYSYGHIYNFTEGIELGGFIVGRHRYLLPAMGALYFIGLYFLNNFQAGYKNICSASSFASLFLVLWASFQIGAYYLGGEIGQPREQPSTPGMAPYSATGEKYELPDIYYIVLDGFGRPDVLEDLYGVDLGWMLNELEGDGFYIADLASSNYSATTLSLASALNMQYLTDIAEEMGDRSQDHRPLEEKIEYSEVRKILSNLGYEFITFETGYLRTTVESSDIIYRPVFSGESTKHTLITGFRLNEFEGELIETTVLRIPYELGISQRVNNQGQITSIYFQQHRQRVLFAFDQIRALANREGPQFVFAHIISPHPPFVFGASGELIDNQGAFSLRDRDCCGREEYIEGYKGQVTFISKLLVETIDELINHDTVPPIIIIQGDHGPAAYYSPTLDITHLQERMSILNAYLVPIEIKNHLYPDITPVNSFRLILDEGFGEDFQLLPDRNYYSEFGYPYNLSEVTGEFGELDASSH